MEKCSTIGRSWRGSRSSRGDKTVKLRIAIKRAIDAAMLFLFIYLMNYHAFGNLVVHAWAGIVLFLLFIVHNILNCGYWRALIRGKYNARRAVLAVTNIALFLLMIAMAISSCMMSRAVFYNSPFPMSWTGRALHKLSTSWGFIVMAVHLSLHLQSVLGTAERCLCMKCPRHFYKAVYVLCSAIAVLAGALSFYRSGLWRAMFLIRGHGSISTPAIAAAEYLFILLAAAVIVKCLSSIGTKHTSLA